MRIISLFILRLCCHFYATSLQIFFEKTLNLVEGYHLVLATIVEVAVGSTGDGDELFTLGIRQSIHHQDRLLIRPGLIAMDEQAGLSNLVGIGINVVGVVAQESCRVPAKAAVDGAWVIATFGAVVFPVVPQEIGRVLIGFGRHGDKLLHLLATGYPGTELIKFTTCFKTLITIGECIEGSHRDAHHSFYTGVHSCQRESVATPSACAYYSDAVGIHVITCHQIVYGRGEVVEVDVSAGYVTDAPTTLAS